MTFRKRRNPTPAMRMPPPYDPVTGTFASLAKEGESPHCALVQIAAEDTHDNYVICRGYDTRIEAFYLYDEADETKNGFAVGKPYGRRQPGQYTVGQVFPALLPLCQLGQNPGKAATSQGHPADLDETIEFLKTDEGIFINWLLLDTGQASTYGKLDANLDYNDTEGVTVSIYSDPDTDSGNDIENVLPPPWMTEGTLASGVWVEVVSWGGAHYAIDPYVPLGDSTNDILYWNATTKRWVVLDAPSTSGIFGLTVTNGTIGWTEFQNFSCP